VEALLILFWALACDTPLSASSSSFHFFFFFFFFFLTYPSCSFHHFCFSKECFVGDRYWLLDISRGGKMRARVKSVQAGSSIGIEIGFETEWRAGMGKYLMDRDTHRQIHAWMDGWMDGWVDGLDWIGSGRFYTNFFCFGIGS